MSIVSDNPMVLDIEQLSGLSYERRAGLLNRGRGRLRELQAPVRRILEDVRAGGDVAALAYAERFDTRPSQLRVPEKLIQESLELVDSEVLAALRQAAGNIEHFHQAQLAGLLEQSPIQTIPGARLWRVWRPIERVGIYVPGGGALYPSCLLMAAIPARVAGCAEIVACTPAGADGSVPAPVLAAAAIAGVTELYALGGVQAIAAMAYGTETIQAVDKVFGPGSSYVATAKTLIAGEVAVDLPAGPSEILILADESANPDWLAADLLAQAEHGYDSATVLVTTSETIARETRDAIAGQLQRFGSSSQVEGSLKANGAILVAHSLDEAIDFANAYAAEHLEIVTREPELMLERVKHAGAVFLGGWSPVAAGDYATGGNHTLPTAGYGRAFGPLAVESFGRRIQVQRLEPSGLAGLRETVEVLARAEGLPYHARSVDARFDERIQEARSEATNA